MGIESCKVCECVEKWFSMGVSLDPCTFSWGSHSDVAELLRGLRYSVAL